MEEELPIPAHLNEYIEVTLNKMGVVTSYMDRFTREFIHESSKQDRPVLEVGPAYGYVVREVLKNDTKIIAIDLEPKHLKILLDSIPKKYHDHLKLIQGRFPEDITLYDNSLGGCYMARVMDYMSPDEMRKSLKLIYKKLVSGARLYILSITIYRDAFKNLIPIYEKRVAENEPWPGYFVGLHSLLDNRYVKIIPDTMNILDETVLKRELTQAGFDIKLCKMYARTDLPIRAQYDGREGVVAIAEKP